MAWLLFSPASSKAPAVSVEMWIDAHNHLQDPALTGVIPQLEEIGMRAAVVNGTQPSDWPLVRRLAEQTPWIYPAFGVHPWFLTGRTDGWQADLEGLLKIPRASLGEIGLDRRMQNPDMAAQEETFRWQLALAARHCRPASIHCVQASGALLEILRSTPLPACGFLLHAYSGSLETARGCLALGAYFSFSGHFLPERRARQREVFAQLPLDRLLVETDAPFGANNPANIVVCYEGLARLRNLETTSLAATVEENFLRLFGA